MNKLDIELNILSDEPHISGIVSGFILLEKQNKINLKINNRNSNHPHNCLVEAIINNNIKVAYDLLDGYNMDIDAVDSYLNSVDFYFKRSFSASKNLEFKNYKKIHPLGFNYYVTTEKNPMDNKVKDKIINYIKILLKGDKNKFYVEEFESIPTFDINRNPKVIFCTRLWNPDGEPTEGKISEELRAERKLINKLRIDIIQKLKELLGNNFIGGVSNTDYARKVCPQFILDGYITKKKNYLEIMKDCDICIGSMGLHESIGWKTGEYIASSKAIINEAFKYKVIGEFRESENYLSFTTSDECVNHVMNLIKNPKYILDMQNKNYIYYNKYLRPDMQVFNSILKAIELSNSTKI